MTIVATWVNLERIDEPSIWTVADTKISDFNDHDQPLTLGGAKVFDLPIVCKMAGGNNYGATYYQASMGFSYAGSSIVGLNTFATLSAVLCNLGGGPNVIPDHENIIDLAFRILRVYCSSVPYDVEISLWGFCPKSKIPFIGILKVDRGSQSPFSKHIETGYFDKLSCILLGSHKTHILEKITKLCDELTLDAKHAYWRVPLKVLHEVVDNQLYPEIGGNLQVGIVSQLGTFGYFAVSVPLKGTNPVLHTIKYRNIDLFEEFGRNVGDCIINLPAIIVDFPER